MSATLPNSTFTINWTGNFWSVDISGVAALPYASASGYVAVASMQALSRALRTISRSPQRPHRIQRLIFAGTLQIKTTRLYQPFRRRCNPAGLHSSEQCSGVRRKVSG
eukprot:1275812-Amphidinium_carterae.2